MPSEDRLVGVTLALEDALIREDWEEADALFASREQLYETVPPLSVPHEVDDIDARILARLRQGLSEIRREFSAIEQGRRAASAYGASPSQGSRKAA